MRRIALILVSLLLSTGIMADSQRTTSGGRGRNTHRTEQQGNTNKHPERPSRPESNHRPQRPDRPGGQSKPNRPNRPSRPDRPQQPGHRPGTNNRPPAHKPNAPTLRPHRPSQPSHMRPPHPPRPHRPAFGFHRPQRPAHWRPLPGAPTLGQIIGITIGAAFNSAINHLVSQGISYTDYGNNMVCVNNVSQYGYIWPQGTLYYNNGYLAGGEFQYYTGYSNTQRYYNLSQHFTNQWGTPYNVTTGASMTATWFTPDNGYVTLQYEYQSPNFVTSLIIGQ